MERKEITFVKVRKWGIFLMALLLTGFHHLRADCTFGDIDSSDDPFRGCSGVVTITGTFTVTGSYYTIYDYPITEIIIDGGAIVFNTSTFVRFPKNSTFRIKNGGQLAPYGYCTNSTQLKIGHAKGSCTGEGFDASFSFQDIIDAGGFDQYGLLTPPPGSSPVAAFSYADLGGGSFQFTDESTNEPTSWFWDFEDGSTTTARNPAHTFDSPGTYTVCLMVSNAEGSDETCRNVTVNISSGTPPVVSFSYVDLGGGSFQFTDESLNEPTSWLWDFGDGKSSTAQHPGHTYGASGDYTVCLTAANADGSDQACQELTVTLPPPGGDCTFGDIRSSDDPFLGCTGEIRITGQFTVDESYNNFSYQYNRLVIDGGSVVFTGYKFWRLPPNAQLCVINGGFLDDTGFCEDGMRIAIKRIQISCTGGGSGVLYSFDEVNQAGCIDAGGLSQFSLTSIGENPENDLIEKTEVRPVSIDLLGETMQNARSSLQVFPNPVSEELRITRASLSAGGEVLIRVFDANGRLMEQIKTSDWEGSYNLPVQELNSGIYLLQLVENDQIQTIRFVKQ